MKCPSLFETCLYVVVFGMFAPLFGCDTYQNRSFDDELGENQAEIQPQQPEPPGPPGPPEPESQCKNPQDLAQIQNVKIYPEHVGVFTSVGTQQFVALGTKPGGGVVNITTCVDWMSSDSQVASINSTGLATLTSTYGRIDISVVVEGLRDRTSLTVVNATELRFGKGPTSADITRWPAWPNTTADQHFKLTTPESDRLYLFDVRYTSTEMSWKSLPHLPPYPAFPNGLNGMICAVWSENGGRTFIVQSWDYVADYSHGKHIAKGMPDGWMGAIVHSFCDFKAGECNGRNRSNLFFSSFPSP